MQRYFWRVGCGVSSVLHGPPPHGTNKWQVAIALLASAVVGQTQSEQSFGSSHQFLDASADYDFIHHLPSAL